MEEAETKIWVHLTLYGGTALVVLGAGLYALIEAKPIPGVVFTVGGLGGVVYAGRRALGRGLMVPNWLLLTALVLTWVFLGYDIYDRHSHPIVAVASQNCPGCDAWDDSKPLERVYGSQRHFVDEVVSLDGRHFINPVFDHVTFVYQGTGPVQMDNPTFVKARDGQFAADVASKNKVVTEAMTITSAVAIANGCNAKTTNFGPNSTLPTVPTAP
jgi:hypothetical protein